MSYLFIGVEFGGPASAAVHLLGPGSGFVQIQRPHLPDGHALRQGALGEALARPPLAHLVAASALLSRVALLSQHVRHYLYLFYDLRYD